MALILGTRENYRFSWSWKKLAHYASAATNVNLIFLWVQLKGYILVLTGLKAMKSFQVENYSIFDAIKSKL
jgi:hypothetical protein